MDEQIGWDEALERLVGIRLEVGAPPRGAVAVLDPAKVVRRAEGFRVTFGFWPSYLNVSDLVEYVSVADRVRG